MRITELRMIYEVKDEYIKLRREGRSRSDATQDLIQSYMDELISGAEDDGILFWIGLADGQYYRKEISSAVAQEALAALEKLSKTDWDITPGDIQRRKEHYLQAPMPEKKVGKPRPKYCCDWKNGDTFAYQIKGELAEKYGIAGKYMLFRKVDDDIDYCGRTIPVVTLSLWECQPLPKSTEEFKSVPMLKLRAGRLMWSVISGNLASNPAGKYEYRTEFLFRNKKHQDSMSFEYLGNFQDVKMPDDEVFYKEPGCTLIILPNMLDEDCAIHYKLHLFYTTGVDIDPV